MSWPRSAKVAIWFNVKRDSKMPRGRGKIESGLLRILLDHELSKSSATVKAKGLATTDLARRVFTYAKLWPAIPEAKRISVSRALNKLCEEGMVVKRIEGRESAWRINPRVVIR
jgi:hypothetical protein